MPRTLDLNNARDSWIEINRLTADIKYSDKAVGQVDWKRAARKSPLSYAVDKQWAGRH